MYVSYEDAIRIILPRDLHIGDEVFEAVEVGDQVRVEIQKSRFQVNDPYILSVGLFRGKTSSAAALAAVPAVPAPVLAPVEEVLEEVPEEVPEEEAPVPVATANENLLILEGGKKKRVRKAAVAKA